MEDKTIITYIKNGEEKVITLNNKKMNKLLLEFKLRDVFNIFFYEGEVIYDIRPGVNFIHIKNCCFKENTRISGDRLYDKILILDNCTFEKESLEIDRVNCFKVLNPKFKVAGSISVDRSRAVSVVLNKETKKIGINASDVSKFYLDSSPSLTVLYLDDVFDVYLKNVESSVRTLYNGFGYEMNMILEKCFFKNSNLVLDDDLTYCLKLIDSRIYLSDRYVNFSDIVKLNLENSSINSESKLAFRNLRYLYLKSSYIKSEKSMRFDNLEKIVFDDEEEAILDTSSYLESGKSIRIGERVIEKYSLVNNLIINEKSMSEDLGIKRQFLIFVLEEYKKKLESTVEEELRKVEKVYEEELKLIQEQNKEKLNEHKKLLLSKNIRDL